MVYFYLVVQQLIGSTTHLVAQNVTQSVNPGLLLLFRSLGASVVFLLLLFGMERKLNIFHRIAREDWGRMILLGILNVPMNQLLYLHGIEYTSPENSALLYSLTPILVFLFSSFFHSERPSWRKALGIALAFIGAGIIMFERGASLGPEHITGNVLIFLAVVAWSFYTLLGRPMVLKYGPVYVVAMSVMIGTITYLPFGLLTSNLSTIASFTSVSWAEVGYLALISSVLNYILWYAALAKLEATRVAIFQNLQPIITTALAIYFEGAVLTMQFLGGGALALIGVLVVEFS